MKIDRRSLLRLSLTWPATLPLWSATLLQGTELKDDRREETLTRACPAKTDSIADAIVIKHEDVFFVARSDGSVPLRDSHGMGLFYHDCRYVNGYEIELAGRKPAQLSASSAQGAIGVFALTNPRIELMGGDILDGEKLGITWRRLIDSETPALRDRLHIQNFTLQSFEFPITLTIQSAFEDLFTVREIFPESLGTLHSPFWEGHQLCFSYDGKDGVFRKVTVYFDPPPNNQQGTTAEFVVRLSPHGQQRIDVTLVIGESKDRAVAGRTMPDPEDFNRLGRELERETELWMTHVTKVVTNGTALDHLMESSFRGLLVLRTHLWKDTYFSAGVPWFVTLFGRDSLITAWQMLAYHPRIAEQTLRLLTKFQGTKEDQWRDAQPGKILHELRVGEMANLHAIPHTPFYATVDSTPLFLMLVAEHAAWTGSLSLFHELRVSIERALSWMDTYGDRHGEAYLTYGNRSKSQLLNHGWKDSDDAIVNADGEVALPPIALVEVQGYAYAAKLGIAGLFKQAGDRDRSERLIREARRLRERFNRDFWMEEEDCYALALQRDGRPAAVISSNAGQALWSGIVEQDRADRMIRRLMAEDMFNGWGVRTLSSKARAYNPIGYHLGTVWPHDNSIIAAGFRRYGQDVDALRIFHGLFDAAYHFQEHQLPELFCGFGRTEYEVPVSYPVACHPQAWASGALPFLLTTLLGLTPEGFEKRLRIRRPMLPNFLDRLEMRRLHVGGAVVDLAFRRGTQRVDVDVLMLQGVLDIQVDNDGHERN
jgi:glycogen debranching enzyme